MANKLQSVKLPENWQDNFKMATFRTSFTLSLSQAMIEFLCSVADGVHWDRAIFNGNIHRPDNWVASATSLLKRGLIRPATEAEKKAMKGHPIHGLKTDESVWHEWNNWVLTPIGDHMVEIFKLAGIFVESDQAIVKKSRRA